MSLVKQNCDTVRGYSGKCELILSCVSVMNTISTYVCIIKFHIKKNCYILSDKERMHYI